LHDITVTKIDEAYVRVDADRGILMEISDHFTFFAHNYQFHPKYKNKQWDGRLRLLDVRTNKIYHGLVPYIEKFCEERKYSVYIEPRIKLTENFSVNEAEEFIKTLNLPAELELRDYQVKAFVHAIRDKRMLIISPTASGKSLIQYFIVRKMQDMDFKRGLLIVPNISLCHQMFGDFESYGYDAETNCHIIHQGKEKQSGKFLYISTWQSLFTMPKEYFEQFDFVINDEVHQAKAKSLTSILTNLTETKYRIGCTGSLDGSEVNKLVLEGLFGPAYSTTTTKELIDSNHLSAFKIKCLILKHPESVCKAMKGMDYQKEMDYIVKNDRRNAFLKNLVLSLKGNTLVLFQYVEKHGKELHRIIEAEKKNRKVFFIFGGTDVEIRESTREIVEREKDAIIIASYGVFSTGVSIRNLHNIIAASSSKSRVRTLQSIGRVLRRGNDKDAATLYDIADDFRTGKYVNFTLKHFIERVKLYDEQKFEYKFYNIELNDG